MPPQLSQLTIEACSFGNYDVIPTSSDQNIGVIFDTEVCLRRHIDVTVSHCFTALRQLCSFHRYVTVPAFLIAGDFMSTDAARLL